MPGESRTRRYRSELRQRQAAGTRRRVVEAAAVVFSENGYQAATFAQIAQRAGVSIETVQKHGPKTALLWAAVEVASFGVEGEIDISLTEQGAAIIEARDPDEFAKIVSEAMFAINEAAAGVWTALAGAAHGDSGLRDNLAERLAGIRGQVENVLRVVAERGWLRTDVAFDDLVEACCVITSVESYVRFVLLDRKSQEEYQSFVARMLRDTILFADPTGPS